MDLEDFLNLEDRYGDFWQNSTSYRALEGLSSALECVHIFNLNITDHSLELSRIGYHSRPGASEYIGLFKHIHAY